ncbi:osmotically inducible protein OsmC [Jannaschia seohaensis]|uniref:Osmotically inducible protein OsmC n=1 Tax=Jannaschia seohaensis TaxID=475081 RepID=A0A2Y9ARF3_9RHOB|nr:osmotically inducible protein OsmC [Jannaschia seohaensis]SSA46665.1 osmotically inducible protein OsmC [Jannaschia seohaensis]
MTVSHLTVSVSVPGAEVDAVRATCETAKTNCPISKLLTTEITMDVTVA